MRMINNLLTVEFDGIFVNFITNLVGQQTVARIERVNERQAKLLRRIGNRLLEYNVAVHYYSSARLVRSLVLVLVEFGH